jgi:hypothetical protein
LLEGGSTWGTGIEGVGVGGRVRDFGVRGVRGEENDDDVVTVESALHDGDTGRSGGVL